jgi:hypothetical protein
LGGGRKVKCKGQVNINLLLEVNWNIDGYWYLKYKKRKFFGLHLLGGQGERYRKTAAAVLGYF